ncbi:hypothetical protein HK096_004150 [Nowakowskiella sp. JEL0078]|nr:hypothetical protein HK096_004150 [Nowakowskiella sp. JEL0078]
MTPEDALNLALNDQTTEETLESMKISIDSHFLQLILSESSPESFDKIFQRWCNVKFLILNSIESVTESKAIKIIGRLKNLGPEILTDLNNSNNLTELSKLPSVDFTYQITKLVTEKCIKLFARSTIDYLLRTQWFGIADDVVTLGCERHDDALLYHSLCRGNVTEEAIVRAIKYVLTLTENSTIVKQVFFALLFGGLKQNGDGVRYNEHNLIHAFKTNLDVDEVEALLDWANVWLVVSKKSNNDEEMDVEVKKFDDGTSAALFMEAINVSKMALSRKNSKQMWWVWNVDEASAERRRSYKAAVELVSILIDSHLSTLLLNDRFHEALPELLGSVHKDNEYLGSVERGLSAAMSLLLDQNGLPFKNGRKAEPKKKQVKEQRKNWRKMVGEINDGVGEYSVEVFNI